MNLMETIINQIKTLLQNNMPAKLDSLDTTYGDGIILRDIAHYYLSEKQEYPDFPSIIILGDSGETITQTSDWLEANQNVIISIVEIDSDEEIITKKIYRYIRAILEILWTDVSLNSTAWNIDLRRWDYYPLMKSKTLDGIFAKEGQVEIVVKTEEV